MKTLCLITALLICAPAFAAKHAPLPDALLNAKTVYIVNQTGSQKVMDGAYSEITKWGRYSIAKDKESADTVMVFTRADQLVKGTSQDRVTLSVYLPNSQDPVYEDTSRRNFNSLAGIAKACVNNFRKRVEEK